MGKAKSGFLFIKALGNVGFYVDGAIHWDIAILVAGFGLTLVISQVLSGRGMPVNKQQSTANKITPVMITGMFLFFPLPAGVLLYMVIANIFQGLQTFLLSREALPDNLQKILDDQLKQENKPAISVASEVIGDSDKLIEVFDDITSIVYNPIYNLHKKTSTSTASTPKLIALSIEGIVFSTS